MAYCIDCERNIDIGLCESCASIQSDLIANIIAEKNREIAKLRARVEELEAADAARGQRPGVQNLSADLWELLKCDYCDTRLERRPPPRDWVWFCPMCWKKEGGEEGGE